MLSNVRVKLYVFGSRFSRDSIGSECLGNILSPTAGESGSRFPRKSCFRVRLCIFSKRERLRGNDTPIPIDAFSPNTHTHTHAHTDTHTHTHTHTHAHTHPRAHTQHLIEVERQRSEEEMRQLVRVKARRVRGDLANAFAEYCDRLRLPLAEEECMWVCVCACVCVCVLAPFCVCVCVCVWAGGGGGQFAMA